MASDSAVSDGTGPPRIVAVRREGPIEVDGRMDEEAWRTAPVVSGFIAGEPTEGLPARDETEVRLLFDDEAVYVGVRMHDADPASIGRQLTRRDEESDSYDFVEVAFDPNLDRRTAYAFRLTAAGVQVDRYRYDDIEVDGAWEAVWEGATHIDDEGWTAEFRIPLSQLRYDPSPGPQSWGLNITRRRVATGELSYLALESRRRFGGVSAFTVLEGIELSHRPRNLELLPFVLASRHGVAEATDDPFREGADRTGQVGLDGRYGLGSSFVADFSINPDFGQVEVDPAVVNLTAFETFFPEQRPFFTRDDRLFDFELPGPESTLFHSRRIGRSPQGRAPADAAFSDVPRETPIIGAAKVTGRTRDGLSLGGLAAVTDRVRGRTYDPEEELYGGFLAEPRAQYGVLRARQDLAGGDSQVGAIFTHVGRHLPSDGGADFLTSSAHSVGVDFEHSWADREWALEGRVVANHVRGSPAAMLRLQESSVHYFQRPDAVHVQVDSSATSMTGGHWYLDLARRGGSPWTGRAWLGHRTPGFAVNDLGFSTSSERIFAGFYGEYREIEPGEVFREYSFSVFAFRGWRNSLFSSEVHRSRWNDAYTAGPLNVNADFTFLNLWEAGLRLGYSPSVLDDRATRGGPLMEVPRSVEAGLSLGSDPRRGLSASVEAGYVDASGGGSEVDFSLEVAYRPSASMQLALAPTYTRSIDRAQYVTQLRNGGFAPTYGGRYFFADLDTRTLSIDTRLSWAFSPTLTLEVFGQPLLSAGDFLGYKQLARARTFEFISLPEGEAVLGEGGVRCVEGRSCEMDGRRHLDFRGDGSSDLVFEDPDFNLRSLRGNAVLRWEYRPGSQLFLVWQQERRDRVQQGDFSLDRDARALFDAAPANVFVIKVNYWIGF